VSPLRSRRWIEPFAFFISNFWSPQTPEVRKVVDLQQNQRKGRWAGQLNAQGNISAPTMPNVFRRDPVEPDGC